MSDFKVLFIYPNLRKESQVPPSITLLSRILKNHGLTTALFDTTGYSIPVQGINYGDDKQEQNLAVKQANLRVLFEDKKDMVADLNKKIDEFHPDLIAVTATESTFLIAIHLLKNIKNKQIPVILGGVFATFAPERALGFPEIDMICVGEGESTLLELCEKMRRGKAFEHVAGLWIKDQNGDIIRNPIGPPVDINSNPTDFDIGLFEERRLYRPMAGKLYRMLSVETERGCPYRCTYCNSPSQEDMYRKMTDTSFFRKKSFEKVYEEIINYRDVWKVEYLFFWADTFLAMSKNELDQFCEMYTDIKLPFFIQTRPETVNTETFVKLKTVGLHRVALGVEQGNEVFRKKVLGKTCTNKQYIESAQILRDLDISFSSFNMIGLPDETPELVMDTVELNRRINPDDVGCAIFSPFYGTPLRDLAVRKGYMDSDVICPGTFEDSVLDMPLFPKERINGLLRVFVMYVKFPKSRWPEIRQAEEFTSDGKQKWLELKEEFTETYN